MTLMLWIALTLLAVASVVPKPYNSRILSGGAGWILFSMIFKILPEISDLIDSVLKIMRIEFRKLTLGYQ